MDYKRIMEIYEDLTNFRDEILLQEIEQTDAKIAVLLSGVENITNRNDLDFYTGNAEALYMQKGFELGCEFMRELFSILNGK